jgi:histidinol-phosphate/aromatic aminotransferase/cobyric acid decarboxylase-like protein/choline kinase
MQGLILAAGMGRRLGEVTRDRTKCMITVNEITLIERLLRQLSHEGIRRVVIVIGYFGEKVKDLIGDTFEGIEIEYIENDVYYKTNNIYSLYLAKEILLQDDTILFESDLILEDSVIKQVINAAYKDLAVVAKYQNWMEGTAIILNEHDFVIDMIPKKYIDHSKNVNYYKTVNIYRFSREFSENIYVPFLEAYCKAVGHNEYYEQVLRIVSILEDKTLRALILDREKWYEIDDANDLSIAETLFAEEQYELESYYQRFGGFWRFPFLLDFCYLVNPYFPSPQMLHEMGDSFPSILTQYPSGQGIMQSLAANIFHTSPAQIVVGNGAAELIKSLQQGWDGITGIVRPSFDEYGYRTDPERLRVFIPSNENFSYSADDLREFVQANGIERLVLINPDNPSGHFIREDEVLYLCSALERLGCEMVVDESFVDFAQESVKFTLFSSETLKKHSNLIVIKSISKSFGVPGLRLGVLAANEELIQKMSKDVSIWNVNSVAENFLQIIVKYESEYKDACSKIANERERFYKKLNEIDFLRVLPSEANYFLCELDSPYSSTALARYLLHYHNILIKDCSGKPGIGDQQFVRIAVRGTEDNNRVLDILPQFRNFYREIT